MEEKNLRPLDTAAKENNFHCSIAVRQMQIAIEIKWRWKYLPYLQVWASAGFFPALAIQFLESWIVNHN